MDLERTREILEEKGFVEDKSLHEDFGDGYYFESYKKGNNVVNINTSPSGILDITVQAPYYIYDLQEEPGIRLDVGDRNWPIREDLFLKALEIQEEDPMVFRARFCKFFLEFSKWYIEELEPVMKHLSLRDSFNEAYIFSDIGLPLDYYFVDKENEYGDGKLYVNIEIYVFTFKVSIKVGCNGGKEVDFSELYGEYSDVLLSAIEEFQDEQNALLRP